MIENLQQQKSPLWARLVLPFVVLAVGVGLYFFFVLQKEEPPRVEPSERSLQVEVQSIQLKKEQSILKGFGSVSPWRVSAIHSDISGKITAVSPNLRVGKIVEKDTPLVWLDKRDHDLQLARIKKEIELNQNSMDRCAIQDKQDRELYSVEEKALELQKRKVERIKNLYDEDGVSSLQDVEDLALPLLKQQGALVSLQKSLELTQNNMVGLKDKRELLLIREKEILLSLDRSVIKAPYTGRVQKVLVQQGALASPAQVLFEIADDSKLEVKVPILAREALSFLDIEKDSEWYTLKSNHKVLLEWSEGGLSLEAEVSRLARGSERSRMLHLVVELGPTPLKAGMFVKAKIYGKSFDRVVRLPSSLISGDGVVWLAKKTDDEFRLEKRVLQVLKRDEFSVLISEGLKDGEFIVKTHLVSPIPNSLLKISSPNQEKISP